MCLVLFGLLSFAFDMLCCRSFDTKFPEEKEHPLCGWDGDFLIPSEMLQLFLLLLDFTPDLESTFHSNSVLLWFDVTSA